MAEDKLPEHIIGNLGDFHGKISQVEEAMKPILATSLDKCHQNMTPLEKAKLDIVSLYAANSMFWAYLSTRGLEPSEYLVKHELEKVKTYMDKIKEIEDKANAPKLDKVAAKNFVRNALYDGEADKKGESSAKKQEEATSQLKSIAKSTPGTNVSSKKPQGKKRKRVNDES